MAQTGTQTTYFLIHRNLLGAVWVLKRVMTAITIGSLLEQNVLLAVVFVGLREALSAFTDYATARNPVQSTEQSSPPNAPDVMPADAENHNR